MDVTDTAIGDLNEVQSLSQLTGVVARYIQALGWDVYWIIPSGPRYGRAAAFGTYPPEWIARYIEKHYFEIDPVVRKQENTQWSADEYCGEGNPELIAFFDDAKSYGICSGYSFPAIQSWNISMAVSLAGVAPGSVCETDTTKFFQAVGTRLEQLMGLRAAPDLSLREIDVLRGLAAGLLPKQIAYELTISKRTVDDYVSKLKDKLNASSVAHIVSLAHEKGII